jgi:hypothetical protein
MKGKVVPELTAPPEGRAAQLYLETLKAELDDFVGANSGMTHVIKGIRADGSAMLSISLTRGKASEPALVEGEHKIARALERTRENLLRRHSQWGYFERCLQIYEKGTMYLFKPLEAIHWTRRQAILDAQEVIAKTLCSSQHSTISKAVRGHREAQNARGGDVGSARRQTPLKREGGRHGC